MVIVQRPPRWLSVLFQAPVGSPVGAAFSAPPEGLWLQVGEDPADEFAAVGALQDDLIAQLAGEHVDEVAAGGAVEREAPQPQARIPDADAQPALLVSRSAAAGEPAAARHLPYVDHGTPVERVAEFPLTFDVTGGRSIWRVMGDLRFPQPGEAAELLHLGGVLGVRAITEESDHD
jgi:hypothetical protein